MSIQTFIQLIKSNLLLILAGGLLTAAAYWLVAQQKQAFTSEALVSTGIISSGSIRDTEGGKSVDRDYAQNELENLISLATAHKTREELATRLLARYLLLDQADRRWISTAEFDYLHDEVFTADIWALKDTSYASTLANLTAQRDAATPNDVQRLIYSDEVYFGIEYLQEKLKVYRRGNSDMLQFIYTTTDPAICQQTLNEFLGLFLSKQAALKKSQSSEIASFFAAATAKSARSLKDAEARLLQFRVQNNIINYDEQTRTIAIRKEDLEELRFKENMNLQSVEASRLRVEKELGNRSALSEINEGLLTLRQELNQVAIQLAKLEITNEEGVPAAGLARQRELEARREELKNQMSRIALKSYHFDQSPQGVNTQKLLDEWLATIITEEQSQAKLGVIDQRQQEFANIYSQYAPWGSQLTELQRAISLVEEEYLENLHSYNQAMLYQQHNLLATNLELIDTPYLPIGKPDYKRFLMVIIGLLGGSFTVFAIVLALAFLNDSLENPAVVRAKTGLEVATVLPNRALGRKTAQHRTRQEAATAQAMALLLQQIKVETLQKDSTPRLILVASTRQEEGKSWVAGQIAQLLRAEDNRVLYLYPIESGVLPVSSHKDTLGYQMSSRMLDAERIQDLDIFGQIEPYLELYPYIILEIPALLTGKYPLPLLRQFDLTLLVCRANRSWEEADQQALKTLHRAARGPIRAVLNGADRDTLAAFMGELSTARSKFEWLPIPQEKPYRYDL
ncbi:MAG: hypothetical protein DA408_09930 [Bacteroidetes bacterium]|nr:MAG: hypothetical protein C7N36_07425 [Bacteroidota bacterium]PTM12609.1 MAG: hypothetical protein DA408_09930 [Bacteroidota bacterium]